MVENEITIKKIDSIKKQIEDYKKYPICRRLPYIKDLFNQFNEVLDYCKKSLESKGDIK